VSVVDFERLDRIAAERRAEFAAADPFPHVVLDDFLPEETAAGVLAEFDRTEQGWKHYTHYNERKLALTDVSFMQPATRALFDALQSERFVGFIEALTGLEDLLSDPDLDGAGLHRSLPGGFLNLHVDFLSHTKNRSWSRQINLLLYLNREWQEAWNGGLELWDADLTRCARKVVPAFNRCVIFHTQPGSYHGHPAPLACPEGESRKSIALYYFREEGVAQNLTSTHYRARPDDPLHRRLLVAADRTLLRAYSALKRYTPVSDAWVSRILRRF
jgi:Rps23 Pro-64 3,4-dihydroxylase Tpa1-like proline 4-hydroxylase